MKILDTSVISAAGKNIRSIDLIKMASDEYVVAVTKAVKEECGDYVDGGLTELADSCETVDDPRISAIAEIIRSYRDVLGSGERTVIAASLILTSENVPNYAVLDDRKAREFARNAGSIPEVKSALKGEFRINVTGTVGLVKHLCDRGIMTKKQSQDVAFDLEMGDFRISRELLDLLR